MFWLDCGNAGDDNEADAHVTSCYCKQYVASQFPMPATIADDQKSVSALSCAQHQRFCRTLSNVVADAPSAVVGTVNNDAALLLIMDTFFAAVDFEQFLPSVQLRTSHVMSIEFPLLVEEILCTRVK